MSASASGVLPGARFQLWLARLVWAGGAEYSLTLSFGYSSEPLHGARMQYIALTPSVECVDDPRSSRYNQLFDSRGVARDWNSSEQMRRDDELYRWGVLVAHNVGPAVGGAGSCVFLHIWQG